MSLWIILSTKPSVEAYQLWVAGGWAIQRRERETAAIDMHENIHINEKIYNRHPNLVVGLKRCHTSGLSMQI